MAGGQAGSRNYTQFLFADGRAPETYGKTAQLHLKKGDVARLITGSGGGYGDPMARPVEQVQDDVRNGYITLDQARQAYGLVLDPKTLGVKKVVNGRP
jgi:N-methylhydantoinase B